MKSAMRIVVSGLAAGVLTMFVPGVASADPIPLISVTPDTDLTDGTAVSAVVSGFPRSTTVFVVECAQNGDFVVCDQLNRAEVATDDEGAATATVMVRRMFDGFTEDGMPAPVIALPRRMAVA